jgi:hypothetical protein
MLLSKLSTVIAEGKTTSIRPESKQQKGAEQHTHESRIFVLLVAFDLVVALSFRHPSLLSYLTPQVGQYIALLEILKDNPQEPNKFIAAIPAASASRLSC